MSLGPQCWRCRKRRVRCDSLEPTCSKCSAAGVPCPGYGKTKPVTWRTPLVATKNLHLIPLGTTSAPKHMPSTGYELELGITIEFAQYYNLNIAPDLFAIKGCENPYVIPLEKIGELPAHIRQAYISISATHRLIKSTGGRQSNLTLQVCAKRNAGLAKDIAVEPGFLELLQMVRSGNMRCVFYCSQHLAMKSLQHAFTDYKKTPTKSMAEEVLSGILLILNCQVQASAYSPWHIHIEGAWAFLLTYGDPIVLAADPNLQHIIHDLLLTDVIGTTTGCILPSTTEIVLSRHPIDAIILRDIAAKDWERMPPIPNQTVQALIRVNLLRAQQSSLKTDIIESLQAIIHDLYSFQHSQWADSVALCSGSIETQAYRGIGPVLAGKNASDILPWRALTKCFHSCTLIYAIHGVCGFTQLEVQANDFAIPTASLQSLWEKSELAYHDALEAILFLFDSKNNNPEMVEREEGVHTLHKFVLWPVVITGTYAVIAKCDESIVERLSSHLEELSSELGSYSMSDGAKFLRGLWTRTRNTAQVRLGWNDIYQKNPLFMM